MGGAPSASERTKPLVECSSRSAFPSLGHDVIVVTVTGASKMDQLQARLDSRQTERHEWIAVVDDDPSIRSSLARLMRSEGMVVETFAASNDFLAAIASDGPPSCLVLDVHLGTESGLELQETLAVTHATIPVIMLTGLEKIYSAVLSRSAVPD